MCAEHRAVARAIRMGILPPPTRCCVCGTAAVRIVHHHPFSDQPLTVRPVCDSDHRRLHANMIADPETGLFRAGAHRLTGPQMRSFVRQVRPLLIGHRSSPVRALPGLWRDLRCFAFNHGMLRRKGNGVADVPRRRRASPTDGDATREAV